jgi:hypothetical protein
MLTDVSHQVNGGGAAITHLARKTRMSIVVRSGEVIIFAVWLCPSFGFGFIYCAGAESQQQG